jgi:hypothetical protein
MQLEYPQWQEPLAAAILEFDPKRLPGKLRTAEEAIASRIRQLECRESNEHELRLLYDGSSILRDLKQERLSKVN